MKLRLEATKELLLENPGLTIKDIAYVVGFEDPSYLSRIFKREKFFGCNRMSLRSGKHFQTLNLVNF
ncbi:helix-turn-helix domain-containing protein [Halalkalibacterium halodurans]|uniref:helix-turn-helix domain-containing protein n=1 Tax=Halalkalibacterium halodurans TaxID=86665 RepID=UPI00399D0821